jgi:hypothetical protein
MTIKICNYIYFEWFFLLQKDNNKKSTRDQYAILDIILAYHSLPKIL